MDSSLLRSAVKRITISTRFGPPYVIEDPFAPSPPAPPNPWLALAKPMISVDVTDVGIYDIAPWGKPGKSLWPEISAGLTVAGSFALSFVGYKLARGIFK